jgi:DNA-directed RNA polymerase subunit E'/Rpb7
MRPGRAKACEDDSQALVCACRSGISLSLGFTQDVFIPEQYMQSPGSMFEAATQQWVWQYEDEKMALSPGSTVRFKVREVTFPRLDNAALSIQQEGVE